MGGVYNWNGSPPNTLFTPPYSPPQSIIGTTSGSQQWKMTPPSSQSTSQQYKNLMQPHEMSSQTAPELRMERTGWNTPIKRPADNPRDILIKRKKEEPTYSNNWETSSFTSTYSDSDSLNDSFSSCSSQKSDFSSQPVSQPIFPSKSDASTECMVVERNDMSTQTESSPYSIDDEIPTLLKRLLDHPEFVSFTNLLSSQIDGDEELLAIVDRNFVMDREEDGDKTQPLEEEETEGADESGNESDHSDIIDL